jgi:hypothetical protein
VLEPFGRIRERLWCIPAGFRHIRPEICFVRTEVRIIHAEFGCIDPSFYFIQTVAGNTQTWMRMNQTEVCVFRLAD